MRLLGLLALPLFVFALAGCGDSSGVVSLDPVAKAAERTESAPPAHFTMDVRFEGQDGIRFTGTGVITDHGNTVDMRMHVPNQGSDPAFDAEVVMIDGDDKIYMKTAAFGDALPAGKHWVSMEDDDPLGDLGQDDPGHMLEYLRATGSVKAVGRGDVRGVSTRHYAAQVDLHKLADTLDGSQKQLVETAAKVLGDAGSKTIPLDVWVGADGYVHRFTMDWRVHDPKQPADSFRMRIALDLYDFGTQDAVPHPPSDETISFKDVLEQIQNGGR